MSAACGEILERIELVILSRQEELARVAHGVDGLRARHRVPLEAAADMNVALDEVLSNVLRHAYADDAEHEIRIVLSAHPRALCAQVEDDGRPFDPLSAPPPERAATLAESRLGGLGIHFVRKLMSEVSYERSGGRNRLHLVRTFEEDG